MEVEDGGAPLPLPDPIQPYEKKVPYSAQPSTTTVYTEAYSEPTFTPAPDVKPLPKATIKLK